MLKEITMFDFNDFSCQHSLYSFYQTSNFAILKSEYGYDYEYLGYYENNILVAATMIIFKHISFNKKYAYAPRGFLIDYNNIPLLKDFTDNLTKYLYKKKFVFLKLDPLLIMKEIDSFSNQITLKQNNNIINTFEDLGYKKLKDNLYFEAQLPRFDGYINLKNFSIKNIRKNTRNKINKSIKKGLIFEKSSQKNLAILYEFIKKKKEMSFKYLNDLYKVYDTNNLIDLFLVKVDYEILMEKAKQNYEDELQKNNYYNELLKENATDKNLNRKMASDRLLISFKNDIMEASRRYKDNNLIEYIAGALVIKSNNKVNIVYSGFNQLYRHLNPNYFLYYSIISYYKENYDFLGLNGLTGDFSKDNPYYGLNEFKLGFKPTVYEYIGELDLIINPKDYHNLLFSGKLHQEFDLKNKD